jgi:aspartate-semialdehyde dehydrogenase
VAELEEQLVKTVDGAAALTFDGRAVEYPAPVTFPDVIAHNVVPVAGHLVGDGSGDTSEEQKFRQESRKILDIPGWTSPVPAFGYRCSPGTRWPSWPSSNGR